MRRTSRSSSSGKKRDLHCELAGAGGSKAGPGCGSKRAHSDRDCADVDENANDEEGVQRREPGIVDSEILLDGTNVSFAARRSCPHLFRFPLDSSCA